jgi:tRNA (guanine37-N1)-methyltransferase
MKSYYILSLFPEPLKTMFVKGLFEKAIQSNLFSTDFIDIRDFATGKHRKVDDRPFGGKKGMILKAECIEQAITSIENYEDFRLLYTCPKGRVFDQSFASELVKEKGVVIVSGYYGGIDHRLSQVLPLEAVSIGDFVVSSGELPALTILDAIVRQIPGVLGNPRSFKEDSIVSNRIEGPVYTSPSLYKDYDVPDILKSGHHEKIKNWKIKESLRETLFKKPELFLTSEPTDYEIELMTGLLQEE